MTHDSHILHYHPGQSHPLLPILRPECSPHPVSSIINPSPIAKEGGAAQLRQRTGRQARHVCPDTVSVSEPRHMLLSVPRPSWRMSPLRWPSRSWQPDSTQECCHKHATEKWHLGTTDHPGWGPGRAQVGPKAYAMLQQESSAHPKSTVKPHVRQVLGI